MEWLCLSTAQQANRYQIETKTPNQPFTPESVKAAIYDDFEAIKILTSTLGFPIFDEFKKPKQTLKCKGKSAIAEGEYTEEGFIIYGNSTANVEEMTGLANSIKARRQALPSEGILALEGDVYRFTENCIFPSPSAAAATVLGRSANGWIEWKYVDGRTLDEVIRQ